jgi:aryl-alcohol dehydrogenase-like predicted oxidoreductase
MQSLNAVVNAGKVLYLGVSDTPAWYVAKANQYARDHGLRQFSVYQGKWSAASRDFERDIIPMTISEGMSLAPWGALGGGQFKSSSQRALGEGRKTQDKPSEDIIKVTEVLEKIAKANDTAITSVALAYVMHKTPYVFPIVGGRKIEHLKGNIEALSLVLSDEDMKEIEEAAPFDLGFPGNMLGKDASSSWLNAIGGHLQYVKDPKPIAPRKV